jgi:hypothetical protein
MLGDDMRNLLKERSEEGRKEGRRGSLLLQGTLGPAADDAAHELSIGIETFLLRCDHGEELEEPTRIGFIAVRTSLFEFSQEDVEKGRTEFADGLGWR